MSGGSVSRYCVGLGPAGFHRIHYCEWGDADNPRVLLCVHGLTRNARDFDFLARRLSSCYRVICPDVVGRGQSDRLTDKQGYQYAQYLADMAVLIARTGAEQVDFLGTSMGGLIGMMLAGQANTPVVRLVMNDVGPHIPLAGLKRISGYAGQELRFADLAAVERHMRQVFGGFGSLTDAQWRHLAVHGVREDKGAYVLDYDPAVAHALESAGEDVDLWSAWSTVGQDVLVLRGADSDILPRATAERMCARNAPTELVEFTGVGHAPALMDDFQVDVVAGWLGA